MTDISTLPTSGSSSPTALSLATVFSWGLQPLSPTALLVICLPPLQPLASIITSHSNDVGQRWSLKHLTHQLTDLMAWKDFVNFSHCGSFGFYLDSVDRTECKFVGEFSYLEREN